MEAQDEVVRSAKRRSLLRGIALGVLASGTLAALLAARPIAAAVQGGGWHGHGFGRWGHGGGSPEAAREHVQVAVKWALREVDASDDQQERVSAILTGAVEDLFKLKERHQANREAFASGLGGATVDRASLEAARKAELAVADEASRRLVQALADAADVLTPEQRQALIEHAHRRHRR